MQINMRDHQWEWVKNNAWRKGATLGPMVAEISFDCGRFQAIFFAESHISALFGQIWKIYIQNHSWVDWETFCRSKYNFECELYWLVSLIQSNFMGSAIVVNRVYLCKFIQFRFRFAETFELFSCLAALGCGNMKNSNNTRYGGVLLVVVWWWWWCGGFYFG